MRSRTLITGALGSGTTTLARSVANRLHLTALDTDNYFWLPTSPPFVDKREPNERLASQPPQARALARGEEVSCLEDRR
jgi:adenylate kinase family enzyme